MAGESSEIQRGEYLPRVADGLLTQALQSSGAVQIKGPKWCGKTATAERQSASQVFMQDPDRSATLLALADTKPSLILRGEGRDSLMNGRWPRNCGTRCVSPSIEGAVVADSS